MDSEFRPLDVRERDLLEKPFDLDFQGRDELRSQMRMLEIIKYGQTAIVNPPTARDLVLIDIRAI